MLIYAIDGSLRPYIIKLIINNASDYHGAEAVSKLWSVTPYFIFLQFLIPLAWRFFDWCLLKYEPALKNRTAKLIYEYLLGHDYHFYQNHFAGSLSSKINDLAETIPYIITTIINCYFLNMIAIIIAIGVLWYVHAWFALIMTIWTIFLIIISVGTLTKFSFMTKNVAEVATKHNGNIVDVLGNILNVRLFAARKYELKRLDQVQNEYLNLSLKRRWFTLKFYGVQGFSFGVYQTICLALLIYLYGQNQVTAGDFALILTINFWIMDGLWQMSDQMRMFSDGWGKADQALETFNKPIKILDKPAAKPLVIKKGEIVFDKVKFHYSGTEPLFENKSVTIKAGQKVGLVGYSGSGKSTFVNLILRLFDINDGQIRIDGQNINDVTQDSLRQAIGMIPQDPSLFHRTIMENIRYGNIEASDKEVIAAAKRAHAHEFIERLPHEYQSLVGERGVKLSGGQRQRIAIARAILKNAPILMLDEATSQLDSVTEEYIQDSLWKLMQNKTTLIVAHRLSTLLNMDRILVFEQGKIVEDGTHKELLKAGGMYKTLWDAQVGGFLPYKREGK
jgi:ATP-binding cassette subfamily B protein